MIYKKYHQNKLTFVMAVVVLISTMIFITPPIVNMSIVRNVNAADKEGPGYVCHHVPDSDTIGKTRCCTYNQTDDKLYCTVCNNTDPPSNCQPRTSMKGEKGGVFDSNNGGVLSQNDDSSGSKGIDSSKIQEGGIFNQ